MHKVRITEGEKGPSICRKKRGKRGAGVPFAELKRDHEEGIGEGVVDLAMTTVPHLSGKEEMSHAATWASRCRTQKGAGGECSNDKELLTVEAITAKVLCDGKSRDDAVFVKSVSEMRATEKGPPFALDACDMCLARD